MLKGELLIYMRIVYMGTPEIAAVILNTLLEDKKDVIAVVTQPDKPKGRGKEMASPPVKELAMKYNIPIYQPKKVKEPEFLEILKELNPDMIIVAAFGQILPKAILELPKYGCINVHASLLPKYRGSAPIQWVIINGEKTTGVTIMHMDTGVDTGDMILKEEVEIAEDETGGSLHDKIAAAGGKALLKALQQIENGTAAREKQDDGNCFYAKMLDKTMGELDFSKSAVILERLIRGLNPWPSAYTHFEGKTLKIWSAKVVDTIDQKDNIDLPNGTVAKVDKDSFYIKTGNGYLKIMEVQLEGKKRMQTADFLRGNKLEEGYCFQL